MRYYNLGVYTEVTKLIYRDYQNLPDTRFDKDVQTYAKKPYKVLQNNKYPVIFFGNKKDWDNTPNDVFGYNFMGFLYYNLKEYKKAIREFKKAIRLCPDNCYAYCKLSRIYGTLFLDVNIKRDKYKLLALEMFEKAKETSSVGYHRISWLEKWLRNKEIS